MGPVQACQKNQVAVGLEEQVVVMMEVGNQCYYLLRFSAKIGVF
jgi:hypothetical protein